MGYSAKAVANYFLAAYGEHGITPLKLQKLVYLAHGWNYAFRDDALIDDEYAEAWKYGPVFPSLYQEFSYLGREPINRLATEIDPAESWESEAIRTHAPRIPKSDVVTLRFLDEIWAVYGQYSGIELSEMCHKPESPWDQTRRANPRLRNAHIDNKVISDHYNELYKKLSSEYGSGG